MIALFVQLIEHLLLVGLGLQVEIGRTGDEVVAGFALERYPERCPVLWIGRIVGLKFAVFPQGLEVRLGAPEQVRLAALGELHGPLQATHQRGARQIGAAHIGRAETAAALEQPGLGMQAGAAAVQRHPDFAAGQAGQLVERADFRGAGVGGGQDAQSRARLAVGADRGRRLQDVEQLAYA